MACDNVLIAAIINIYSLPAGVRCMWCSVSEGVRSSVCTVYITKHDRLNI